MHNDKPWRTKGAYGGLRSRTPSRRHLIDVEAARLVAQMMETFSEAYLRSAAETAEWKPIYEVLRESVYTLGFVTSDGSHSNVPLQQLLEDPGGIASLDFVGIRGLVHTLWRAEHWNDPSLIDEGISPVAQAVRGGALRMIADRLRELSDMAESDKGEFKVRN